MNYHSYSDSRSRKVLSIMQNLMPENPPLYDSDTGNSTENGSCSSDKILTDNELVRLLYTKLNSTLYPFVVEVIDSYDYNGSPIYAEDGIDRETLAQLVSQVLDLASEHIDEIDEIRLENILPLQSVGWDKRIMLNSVTEALILNNIFMYRRPRRNKIINSYSFKNGVYNGLNYG